MSAHETWVQRASTAAATVAVACLGLAVIIGASNTSGPIVVAGYGAGFQPLPRGEQGAVARESDIGLTVAVPVRDVRVSFRARGFRVAREISIAFDGQPMGRFRLPADRSVPVAIPIAESVTPGGHGLRITAGGSATVARPYVIVGDLRVTAERAE